MTNIIKFQKLEQFVQINFNLMKVKFNNINKLSTY